MSMEDIKIDFSQVKTEPPSLIEEQQDVIDCEDDNICTIAGPATGKTRVDEAFVYKLLSKGEFPEDILDFTYTVTGKEVLNKRLLGTGVRAYSIHGHGMKSSKEGREKFLETEDFDHLLKPRKPNEKYYSWVLCDEAQDLTPQQYENFLSWGKRHFLVGDPWQAMFGWAGADPTIPEKFAREYCPRKPFELKYNHRSAERIVSVGNKFSGRNLLWGGNEGRGSVEIIREVPEEIDNITILARTNREVDHYAKYLVLKGIPFTKVTSEDNGRVIRNYRNGKVLRVESVEEYLPTIVMTIHLAKGEEWDNVWLIHKVPWKCDWREEERIFYVGLTRAKKFLYINSNSEWDFLRRLNWLRDDMV